MINISKSVQIWLHFVFRADLLLSVTVAGTDLVKPREIATTTCKTLKATRRSRFRRPRYAPLSRAHCCFFSWTNDAGLLTVSIAPHYTLHFLTPRAAHVASSTSAVTARRLMSAQECSLKTTARASAVARLASFRACTHCPRLLDWHIADTIRNPTDNNVYFFLFRIAARHLHRPFPHCYVCRDNTDRGER